VWAGRFYIKELHLKFFPRNDVARLGTLFDIEGADGPPPARHTLLFDANFILKEQKN